MVLLNPASNTQHQVSVLYVCTGNICRSPLAEALLKDFAARHGASGQLQVSSAGTHALPGNPATAEAKEAARCWGLNLSRHRAREVTPQIAGRADIILAAAQHHQDWLRRRFPQHENKVYLAMLFPQRLAGQRPAETDIPDPVGGSVDYYLDVLNMLKPTLPRVFQGALGMRAGAEQEGER